MPAIVVAPIPSGVRFFGLGKETTRGTAAAPTVYVPMRTFSSPNELPHYADDLGIRGSAVKVYDKIATQTWANPGFDGDAFPDSFGYLLQALMGEVTTTGSTPGTSSTLNGGVAVGATSIVVASATGMSVGNNIQIDTGLVSEVKTIASITTNTITFTAGQTLLFAHLTGVAVTVVVAPFTHVFTVLNNSAAGVAFQPPSYTITDYRGSTNGIQQLPGALVSDINIKGTATGLLQYSVKFSAFRAVNAAKTTPTPSGEPVKAAWTGVSSIGGASTLAMEDFDLKLTRKVDAVPTINGTQDPSSIFSAGDFAAAGTARLVYTGDDTEYAKMVANTSSSIDVNFTTGTGATLRNIQFHASKLKYPTIVPESNGPWIRLPINFEAVANTSDIGNSGGYCPIKFTLVSAIPTY